MQVSELLHKLKTRQDSFKEAKSLYLNRLAPDFSPFDFIEPDEMRLSGILAWLLNPRATHGQSGRFLHLFVKRLFQHDPELAWPSEACEKAEVRTEVWVSDGKLDILVRSNNRTLVIENKVGAADQPKQIERYAAYLDSLKQVATGLVYLTPDGVEPSKESITEPEKIERTKTGQLHCWSYQEHILEWLAECRAVCRADRVSVFIDEFVQYIRKRFTGIADVTEQNQLVQDVTESLATLAPAMQVILAADAIRVKLLSKLHDQIQAEIGQIEGWSLAAWNLSAKEKWSFFSIRFPGSGEYLFSVQFEGTGYNGLIYGINTNNSSRPAYDASVLAAISAHVGPGRKSEFWPWYESASLQRPFFKIEPQWRMAAEPWIAIANGTLAKTIIQTASHFHDVLARCSLL